MHEIVKDYYMNSYLAHHGILGQKWGVRRFQNKDGSLTAAGIMRKKHDNLTQKEQKRYADKIVKVIEQNKSYNDQVQAIEAIVDEMVTERAKEQINKAISDLHESEPTIKYSDYDDEVKSLIDKNYKKYEKIARKKMEYDDEETPPYQDIFDAAFEEVKEKHPNLKKQDDRWNKAIDKYYSNLKHIGDELLGDYSKAPSDPNRPHNSSTLGDEVYYALINYADRISK